VIIAAAVILASSLGRPGRGSGWTAAAATIGVAAETVSASARTVTRPRIVATDSGPVLQLPDRMAAALRRQFPHFRVWPWRAYDDSVRSLYQGSDRDGIRAVVGDLNGDGRPDAAMDGVDTVQYRVGGPRFGFICIVAVLTSGDSAVAVRVTDGSVVPGDSIGAAGRPYWLRLVPAGTFREALRVDAIGAPTRSDAGSYLRPDQVYWWSRRRRGFVQWFDGE
jgi:hypothetical protein